MGAWHYVKVHYGEQLSAGRTFGCLSRPESASPATGSANSHKLEQEIILSAALPA